MPDEHRTRDDAELLPVDLYPWEHPYGDPLQKDRDFEIAPYARQERRIVNYLWAAGLSGGDDPVGFLIASQAYGRNEIEARDAALRDARAEVDILCAEVDILRAEVDILRAEADKLFHLTDRAPEARP